MINRTTIIGRLTSDPRIKVFEGDVRVASFTLAIDRSYSAEHETDFIPVTAWRKTAEIIEKYLSKGCLCGVTGRLQSRSYDPGDGTKRYVVEVVADEVQLLQSAEQTGAKNSGR